MSQIVSTPHTGMLIPQLFPVVIVFIHKYTDQAPQFYGALMRVYKGVQGIGILVLLCEKCAVGGKIPIVREISVVTNNLWTRQIVVGLISRCKLLTTFDNIACKQR